MSPSRRSKDALKAILEIARRNTSEKRQFKTVTVSKETGVSISHLEHILKDLRQAELIMSQRGTGGGYWLARSPALITVLDVVQAIDFRYPPGRRVMDEKNPKRYDLSGLWAGVDECARRHLAQYTLQQLLEKK